MLYNNKIDIELEKINPINLHEKKRKTNNTINSVGLVESASLGIVYASVIPNVFTELVKGVLQFITYPILALGGLIRVGFEWRKAYLDHIDKRQRGKNISPKLRRTVLTAAINTVAAVAIAVVLTGSLVAATIFATVTPIIFTVVSAAKTLFSFGSSIYYAGKAAASKNINRKEKYKNLTKQNVISGVSGLISTAATVMVFLLGKAAFFGLGLVAAVIGVGLAVKTGYQNYKASHQVINKKEKTVSLLNEDEDNIKNNILSKDNEKKDVIINSRTIISEVMKVKKVDSNDYINNVSTENMDDRIINDKSNCVEKKSHYVFNKTSRNDILFSEKVTLDNVSNTYNKVKNEKAVKNDVGHKRTRSLI